MSGRAYREDKKILKMLLDLKDRCQRQPLRGYRDWTSIWILQDVIPYNQSNDDEWWQGFSSSKSASLVLDLHKYIWRDAPEAAQAAMSEVPSNNKLYSRISGLLGRLCIQLDYLAMNWPQLKEYLQDGSTLVHALVRVARLWTPNSEHWVSIELKSSLLGAANFLMLSESDGRPAWIGSVSKDDVAQLLYLNIRFSMAHVKLKMESGWRPFNSHEDETSEQICINALINAWVSAVGLVTSVSFVTFFPNADDSIWLPLVPMMLQSFQMALDLLLVDNVGRIPETLRQMICSVIILGVSTRLLPVDEDHGYNPLAGSRRSSMPPGLTWQLKCALDAIRFLRDRTNAEYKSRKDGSQCLDGMETFEHHGHRKRLSSNSLRLICYLLSRSQPCKASTKQVWEILTALEEAVRMLGEDTLLLASMEDLVRVQRGTLNMLRLMKECDDLCPGDKAFSSCIYKILSIGLTICKTTSSLCAANRSSQPLSNDPLAASAQISMFLEDCIEYFNFASMVSDASHRTLPPMWNDANRWQVAHLLPAMSQLLTVKGIPLYTLLEQELSLLRKRQHNAAECEGLLSWQLLRDSAGFCHSVQDYDKLIIFFCVLCTLIHRTPVAQQLAIVTSWQHWATLELAGFIIKSSPEPYKITLSLSDGVGLVQVASELLFYTIDALACEAFDLKDAIRLEDSKTRLEGLSSVLPLGFSYAFLKLRSEPKMQSTGSIGSSRSDLLMEPCSHASPLEILSVTLDGKVWDSLVGCFRGDNEIRRAALLTGICLTWAAAVLEKFTLQIQADLTDVMALLRVHVSQVLLGGDYAPVAAQSALALLRRWLLIIQTSESKSNSGIETNVGDSDALPNTSPSVPNSMMVLRDWEVVQCELLLGLSEEVWGVRPCSNPSCNRLDGPCELEVKTLACGGMCGARYCCRECQAHAWRSGHCENCSLIREMCQRHRDIQRTNA